MSHFSSIRTQFRHREALIQSLTDLGYHVETDAIIQGHEGKHSVDIAVRTRGSYGIGFVRNDDGTYDMIADWWGIRGIGSKKIADELKEKAGTIQKEYVKNIVLHETAKDGFNVVSQTEEADGTLRIVVRRWAG